MQSAIMACKKDSPNLSNLSPKVSHLVIYNVFNQINQFNHEQIRQSLEL